MAAANTDKFRKKRSNFSTTLNGTINSSDTTIALASTSGLPTDTAITLTIDRVDTNAVSTPLLKERVTGVVSSNNLTNCLRGEDNTTAQSHNSGAVVEDIWDADTWNDAVGALIVEHNQDGTHNNTIVAMLAGAQTITGAKTFGSALLIATRPKFVTSIDDTNGNEVIKITATASAVNELTVANAATGNNPLIQPSGGDTNIGIDTKMKGTAYWRKPVVVHIPFLGSGTDATTGDGKAFFEVPEELNGMNIVAVGAYVYVAGTTNTMDIQLRNVTDSVDVLSTKITIDSTERSSRTGATPAVINASNDDLATGDILAVDVDAVHTTAAKGGVLWMRCELPA